MACVDVTTRLFCGNVSIVHARNVRGCSGVLALVHGAKPYFVHTPDLLLCLVHTCALTFVKAGRKWPTRQSAQRLRAVSIREIIGSSVRRRWKSLETAKPGEPEQRGAVQVQLITRNQKPIEVMNNLRRVFRFDHALPVEYINLSLQKAVAVVGCCLNCLCVQLAQLRTGCGALLCGTFRVQAV